MIRDRNVFGNSLNKCLDSLPLHLPRCLVVPDLEPSGQRPAESDDHEDETNGKEPYRTGLEVSLEDSYATGAQACETKHERSDTSWITELDPDAHCRLRQSDFRVCHGDQHTDSAVLRRANGGSA